MCTHGEYGKCKYIRGGVLYRACTAHIQTLKKCFSYLTWVSVKFDASNKFNELPMNQFKGVIWLNSYFCIKFQNSKNPFKFSIHIVDCLSFGRLFAILRFLLCKILITKFLIQSGTNNCPNPCRNQFACCILKNNNMDC